MIDALDLAAAMGAPVIALPVPGLRHCPECLEDEERKAQPGHVLSVPGFPDVQQCTRCWYRLAHGERAPHIVVQPDGPWTLMTVTPHDGGEPYTLKVDRALGHLVGRNLVSLP